MKKAIFRFFVLLSTCLFTLNLPGQEMKVDTQLNKVIANGGLRLREKPDTSSKILTTIPFGEKVKYLSASSFGTDSIGYTDEEPGQKWVHGNWVKVSWRNQTGFVLDSYLFYNGEFEDAEMNLLNQDYRLVFPGCHCTLYSLLNLAGWKFYGYFGDSTNGLIRKPVTVRYLRSDDVIFCGYIVDIQPAKGLQFAIAAREDVDFSVNIPWVKWLDMTSGFNEPTTLNSKLQAFSLKTIIPQRDSSEYVVPQLYLKKAGKKQLLNVLDYWKPAFLIFCGDLDKDGRNDYIISFGDKAGGTILYLSSKARPGELVRPVAVFFISYCC